MGVYIKGMEMPPSCAECGFEMFDRCGAMYGVLLPSDYLEDITRPNYCPLVAVPAHGRLIDANALADVLRRFIAMYDGCPFSQLSIGDKSRRDELQTALAEVFNAPTIIPAEREGDT